MDDEPISFRHIEEATIQTIPTPPTAFSPRKCPLLSRNDVISTPKNQKKLAGHLCWEQRRHKIGVTGSNPLNSKHNANVKHIRKVLQCAKKYNTDPTNNVITLSNKSFTIYEFKLRNKNLNFRPTPNRYNKTQFRNDINAFIKKIKLQAYITNTEQNLDDGQFRV